MSAVAFIPRVKIETQTIHSPVSKCGDNWWRDIRIRCPYKGTDIAFRTLPSLGDPDQVESMDADFLDEMVGDSDRIKQFISNHLDEMTESQRFNAETMLARAIAYIDDAKMIGNFWANGFSISDYGHVSPWPLNGRPQGPIDASVEEGHKRDGERWRQLVRAALRNLRCAEEVAKKATIRDRNKQRHLHGRRYGVNNIGLGQNSQGNLVLPAQPVVKKAYFSLPHSGIQTSNGLPTSSMQTSSPTLGSELGDEEIDLETEDLEEQVSDQEDGNEPEPETEKAARPSKGKGGTALLVGAAALGLLMFSKK